MSPCFAISSFYREMYESLSSHCPFSYWNFFVLSTTIWPSMGSTKTLYRSRGRGVGPSKLIPLKRKPEPWHGHLILSSLNSTLGVQPRWVHVVSSAASCFLPFQSLFSLTIQHFFSTLNRSSGLSNSKSSILPALKTWGGSKRTLGSMKRSMATEPTPLASPNALQAAPAQDIMNERRLTLGG